MMCDKRSLIQPLFPNAVAYTVRHLRRAGSESGFCMLLFASCHGL